jgi:SAM-dependent methyltransferase
MDDTAGRDRSAGRSHGRGDARSIGILVMADDAPANVARLLDGMPERLRTRVAEVFLRGDGDLGVTPATSGASTAANHPPTLVHLTRQRGDGDTQKVAYRLAIEQGLGIMVVLRGVGPYLPGLLEGLVAPLERGEGDAVIGSRRRSRSGSVSGGAPPGQRIGRRILTQLDRGLGTQLRDPHSGWRAYSVPALASIPFEGNAADGHFDLQVILQLIGTGRRVVEVAAPGVPDEGLRVTDALRRARDTSLDILRLRLARIGYLSGHLGGVGDEYRLKQAENSSHSIVLHWLERMPSGRVLDLGCSSGLLAERVRAFGHRVTGVDMHPLPGVTERVDRFLEADLDRGLPLGIDDEGPYDVVVAADVLEHVRDPERLLKEVRSVLVPGGTLIVSVPNFGHWYPRVRTAVGLFDYDQRGILDRGHVRFFTRRGLFDLVRRSGFTITGQRATGLPFEVLSAGDGRVGHGLRAADRLAVGAWPTLFAYQFVIRCETPTAISRAPAPAG